MAVMNVNLVWLFGVLWVAGVAVNGLTFLLPNPRKAIPVLRTRPGVSILVPVKGIDFAFASNIERLFKLDYRSFEIIFIVAERHDPAVPLIEQSIEQNPAVPARLQFADNRATANPKANNLIAGIEVARHDLLLMCDANVADSPALLPRMLAALTSDVGLAWAIPIATQPSNFPAELECAMNNGFGGRWLLLARSLGVTVCVGKAVLMRRDDLRRLGGFESLLANDFFEDAILAKGVRSLGLHVRIVDEVIEHPIGHRTFREFWNRHVRWHCSRRYHAFLLAFVPELFLGATSVTVAGASFWHYAIGARFSVSLFILASLWLLLEGMFLWRLGWAFSWREPAAWLTRELLLPLMWTQALFTRTVNWRENQVVISPRDIARVPQVLPVRKKQEAVGEL